MLLGLENKERKWSIVNRIHIRNAKIKKQQSLCGARSLPFTLHHNLPLTLPPSYSPFLTLSPPLSHIHSPTLSLTLFISSTQTYTVQYIVRTFASLVGQSGHPILSSPLRHSDNKRL